MCDKKKKKRLNYIIIKKILTKIDESCNFQRLANTSRGWGGGSGKSWSKKAAMKVKVIKAAGERTGIETMVSCK